MLLRVCLIVALLVCFGAWSVLCAGQHNNRVRTCDVHGCGAFNSHKGNDLHKAVDLVCDDFDIIGAPFSGSLAGPVSRKESAGNQFDVVKLLNDVHCVKIFNIHPYRITSHMELQMCDGTDPSTFI
ncbi:hypothetical protein JOQ06_019064 [Pogonophryne albipinna]|uniref:Uncharacterized protein n=1 Tax=Pogonophryne albipinna TaxID=1090488 RepID=A0AAD6AQS8_9TELE|nr:hypothetical protein JOQ06_019064 [Pogonophryne albipinna]